MGNSTVNWQIICHEDCGSQPLRAQPLLWFIGGLVVWLPLGASLLAALADASRDAGRTLVFGVDTSGLGLALNSGALVAATVWAASVHWQ